MQDKIVSSCKGLYMCIEHLGLNGQAPSAGAFFAIAINNASITRSAFGLDFILQPTTCRENKSITTVKYNQPS